MIVGFTMVNGLKFSKKLLSEPRLFMQSLNIPKGKEVDIQSFIVESTMPQIKKELFYRVLGEFFIVFL